MDSPSKTFVKMLEEWGNSVKDNQAYDYPSILFIFAHELGENEVLRKTMVSSEDSAEKDTQLLNAIEAQINHIADTNKIDELLLVRGCIATMDAYCEKVASSALTNIAVFEKMIEECSDNPTFKEKVELFKSPSYGLDILRGKDAWAMVVAKYFGSLSQRFFEDDQLLQLKKAK